MSKSILISIKPEFVEKILNNTKTVEIRKSKPSCELPCKVYIYETKSKYKKGFYNNLDHKVHYCEYFGKGKVVAEFTLNKVDEFHIPYEAKYLYDALTYKNENILKQSCLSVEAILEYLKDKYYGYAWHIDNLKIYDKPKELSEFYGAKECPYKDWGDVDNIGCWESYCEMFSRGECRFGHLKLDRPPQSWCYVE